MGFCLFNNVAIAARAAQAEHGVERVLIIDWDVHHGNGTQDAFYDDPRVFYLSLHIDGHYPGTGAATETGVGAGMGSTLNVPLPAGTAAAEYRVAFSEALQQAFEQSTPDLVLVSAGYDCLAYDPLGGLPDALAGRVRFIGQPAERIAEDGLRVYRFFRFSASHGGEALDACRIHCNPASSPSSPRRAGSTSR